jgi:hypothetical protein
VREAIMKKARRLGGGLFNEHGEVILDVCQHEVKEAPA